MVHAAVLSAALALLGDVNAERRSHGLAPLAIDARLSGVAASHAQDMAARGYFSHTGPGGASPFDRMRAAGIAYQYAGENIALAPDAATANAALFASPPHRENTLSAEYHHIGIAAARDAQGDLLFVEDFSN